METASPTPVAGNAGNDGSDLVLRRCSKFVAAPAGHGTLNLVLARVLTHAYRFLPTLSRV